MKKLGYVLVLAGLLAFSGTAAKADVTAPNDDPRIGAGGGGSCGSVSLTSATQTFTLAANELACIVDFTNNTGAPLTSLVVAVNSAFSGTLTCGLDAGTPFSSFQQPPQTPANTCMFSGANVPDEGVFGLTFGSSVHPFCLNDSTGVCRNLQGLSVTATSAPEPASLALIGTGLAAWWARRKKPLSKPQVS